MSLGCVNHSRFYVSVTRPIVSYIAVCCNNFVTDKSTIKVWFCAVTVADAASQAWHQYIIKSHQGSTVFEKPSHLQITSIWLHSTYTSWAAPASASLTLQQPAQKPSCALRSHLSFKASKNPYLLSSGTEHQIAPGLNHPSFLTLLINSTQHHFLHSVTVPSQCVCVCVCVSMCVRTGVKVQNPSHARDGRGGRKSGCRGAH